MPSYLQQVCGRYSGAPAWIEACSSEGLVAAALATDHEEGNEQKSLARLNSATALGGGGGLESRL
jgi:hypothetical protein